jgi:hypothetical protein
MIRWRLGSAVRFVWAVVLVAACGRFRFDPLFDASDGDGGDATTPCTTFGPFGAPRALNELNSTTVDWGGFISVDKRELWFASDRSTGTLIYRTQRASLGDPFDPPTLVDVGIAVAVDDPFLSDDGLVLWFDSGALATPYTETRSTPATAFGAPQPVNELDSVASDAAPSITSDELTVVFDSSRSGNPDLYIATRSTPTAAFDPPQPIASLDTFGNETSPSISGDGNTLVFVSDRLEQGVPRIVESFRVGGAFQPLHLLDPMLGVPGSVEADPTLSRDGTTIVYSSTRAGGLGSYDLFLAERPCQ